MWAAAPVPRAGCEETRLHPVLLSGNDFRGSFADRQAPPEAVGLGVVVDEHRGAVLVAVQAVAGQGEDVLGPTPGVDADLGGDPHLDGFEGVEVGAQDGHDLRWQVAAGLAAFGFGGDVAALDGEIAGSPAAVCPGVVRPRARIPASTSRTSRQMQLRRYRLISPTDSR